LADEPNETCNYRNLFVESPDIFAESYSSNRYSLRIADKILATVFYYSP